VDEREPVATRSSTRLGAVGSTRERKERREPITIGPFFSEMCLDPMIGIGRISGPVDDPSPAGGGRAEITWPESLQCPLGNP
jgi:hypothetical protein